ncbi:MAG: addiction module protein [Acidobacteriota bacterium]
MSNTPAKFVFCRLGYNRFMTVRQILEEAKRLDPIERAELLEQLYATFEPADPSVDAAWSVEVEERLSAYRAGEIEAAPFEDVLDRIHTDSE